jgi:hypothetical protein
VKYADDLVLLMKQEEVLQGMTDRITEIGRCYEMEFNAERTKIMEINGKIIPIKDYGGSATSGQCIIF